MIFSVGHSNHPIGKFLALLKDAEIDMLVDVRSNPVSRFCPHFNRKPLETSLAEAGLGYQFLGQALGGKPKDKSLWHGNGPDYALIAANEAFGHGIARLLVEGKDRNVAVMCAERDPKDCHRFMLIGRHLAEKGVSVKHILSDGRIEAQDSVEARIGGSADLFA